MIHRLVLENLKHRPIRTLLTILAIALQVTMILTLVGLSRGTIERSVSRTRGIGADVMVRPPASSALGLTSAPMPEKMVEFVAKQPHVVLATATVEHATDLFDRITGIDFPSFSRMTGGIKFIEGGPFQQKNDVIVDDFYAKEHKLHAGDSVTILNGPRRVAGIMPAGKLARVFLDLHDLQNLTGNLDKVSIIYAKVDHPENAELVVDTLKAKLPQHKIYTMEEFLSLVTASSDIPLIRNFTNVVIGLAVVFGFLVVFLAMYTAVLERTREIGILKALGASPTFILRILLRETLLLALIGSVLGILLSYVTKFAIQQGYSSLTQTTVPDWWPIAAGLAIFGAMLGAIYPGLKAARQDAIEALSYE